MSKELMMIFLIAFMLFLMQAAGGWWQIKNYKKAVRRMHQLGNVGIGQTKGRFLSGNLVLISCDGQGVITGAEIMEGLTFLAKFHACESFRGMTLAGTNINTFISVFSTYDKKQRKRYKGYIQAIEALDLRLHHPERLDCQNAAPVDPTGEPA